MSRPGLAAAAIVAVPVEADSEDIITYYSATRNLNNTGTMVECTSTLNLIPDKPPKDIYFHKSITISDINMYYIIEKDRDGNNAKNKYLFCISENPTNPTSFYFIVFTNKKTKISKVFSLCYFVNDTTDISRVYAISVCSVKENPNPTDNIFTCVRNVYYTSLSSIGLYRLCNYKWLNNKEMYAFLRTFKGYPSNEYDTNHLVKGNDYLVSSFVNLYLQSFIETCKNKYEVKKGKIPGNMCVAYKRTTDIETINIENTYSILFDNSRIKNNTFFNFIKDMFPQPTFYQDPTMTIRSQMNNLESIYKDTYMWVPLITIINRYVECHYSMSCALKPGESLTENYYKLVKFIIEDLFNHFYKVDHKSETMIGKITTPISKEISNVNIYRKMFEERTSPKRKYYMYYCDYVWNKKQLQCIICITPTDSQITHNGIYSLFISCGMLIGRIYEYKSQLDEKLTRVVLNDELPQYKHSASENYSFVGDLYSYSFITILGTKNKLDELKSIPIKVRYSRKFDDKEWSKLNPQIIKKCFDASDEITENASIAYKEATQ